MHHQGVFLPNRPEPPAGPTEVLLASERRDPERELLRWLEGSWTVGQFADRARRWARLLADAGVQRGDRVAMIATNDPDVLALQHAAYGLGAVEVPINAELRGSMLASVLADADPKVIVVEEALVGVATAHVPATSAVLALDDALRARADAAQPLELSTSRPGDLAFILYTSGTTGPSKGVMLPHGYLPNMAATWVSTIRLTAADVSYFPLPFFHVDGHVMLTAALLSDSVLGFVKRFSVSRFWSEAAALGATYFGAVGSMGSALVARRPDTLPEHNLRLGVLAPIRPEVYAFFEDELGIPLLEPYGQTEADGVTYNTLDRRRRGSMGWPACGFDVLIADEDDQPVPTGEVGRLLYRPTRPHMMTSGYWRRPDATLESTRNLWWHTGDLARVDDDGFFWFEGRATDSLRRRGENISAWELESAITEASDVLAAAAIPVQDEIGGEDEIKVFLVVEDPDGWDAEAFFAFCRESLPQFAVPRFVELVGEEKLVRGPGTGAVQKHLLPRENTAATIDRDMVRS